MSMSSKPQFNFATRFPTHQWLICLLWLIVVVPPSHAQYHYTFEHLSTENGLSHGSVSAMHKDKRGFMWFGTWDGLNRFDGYAFKCFKPGSINTANPASNRIDIIQEDVWGNIWVVTSDAHAYRLNRMTENFESMMKDQSTDAMTVTDIFMASTGDVWLTTPQDGIYRIVTQPNTNNTQSIHYNNTTLLTNHVERVAEDSLKQIWAITAESAVCLEAHNGQFVPNNAKQLNTKYITASLASATRMYFATNSGQLFAFDPHTQTFRETVLPTRSPVTTMNGNGSHSIFIGCSDNTVWEFDEELGNVTRRFNLSGQGSVLAIYPDSQQRLWVETSEAGIEKIDLQNGQQRRYVQQLDVAPDIRKNAQCGIMEDGNHTLWLTLKGGGFGYYNPVTDEVEYFFNKPGDAQSRVSNFVNCFYCDPSGVLWLSTYFKGIEKITINPKQFRFIQPAPTANLSIANEVRALMEDSRGFLWVATKKQEVFVLDKHFETVKKIDLIDGKPIGMVYCMMEDKQGHIYLGTKGNGLWILTMNGFSTFKPIHFLHDKNDNLSLSNDNIYALHQDAEERIWVGTLGGGINIFDGVRFIHPSNYPNGKAQRVRHITEDAQGRIWMATTDGIVTCTPTAQTQTLPFNLYSKEANNVEGLKGNDIFWISCDENHRVWVASLGGGIALLKSDPSHDASLKFTSFTKTDGLPSDVVFALAHDASGNAWLSSENGIACYDTTNHVFRRFGRSDGITSPVFSEGAMAIRHDGTFCFGANNGLYAFRPSDLLIMPKKIDFVFTGFQLQGKEVAVESGSVLQRAISETKEITLEHQQNAFSFAWAALDYKMSDKLQYAYKLEGYDNDWTYADNKNQANYSKIPPGDYTFLVKFINPELQPLNPPQGIHLTILQPWWKTYWAIVGYILFAMAIVEIGRRTATTIIRLRNKVVIEHELSEAKLRFFTNISHELRTPLTLIIGPAEELEMNEKLSAQGVVYAQLIRQNAQRLLRTVSQLLDFRKVQNHKMELVTSPVELVAFCRQLCHNFSELAKEKNIGFTVHCNVDSLQMQLDAEKMESVIFNLLSNAFKFTPQQGFVVVKINHDAVTKLVAIEIADSGVGISKEQESTLFNVFASQQKGNRARQPGTGIGLALSKELVELHGGQLRYQANTGGGSTFIITLSTQSQTDAQQEHRATPYTLSEQPVHIDSPSAPNEETPCVLVVEDNQELRRFIAMQLSHHFKVVEAGDGEEGLLKAIEYQPDLIVSDVIMPKMDGIAMLEQLKNSFDTSHIPVVLLTSKTSVESKIEGLRYGADAYLTKPFHSGQLLAQLDNLLKQRIILRQHYATKNDVEKPLPGLTERDARFLTKVREFIDLHMSGSEFKIGDIYEDLGMGRSKFYDKLKGLTGLSPIDFVKELRLAKAKALLESGNHNVSEVSFLCGFSDAGYFSKCYKERFGMSPSNAIRG